MIPSVLPLGSMSLILQMNMLRDDIAEIKGLLHSNKPFQHVSDLYGLPVEKVIKNIRSFTNKEYKNNFHVVESKYVKDISFKTKIG